MATETEQQQSSERWAGTAAEWRKRKVHRAELPSGMRVLFTPSSLGELLATEALPEDLLELAAAELDEPGAGAQEIRAAFNDLPEAPSDEQRRQAAAQAAAAAERVAALNRELVAAALVEPRVSADELRELPLEDLEYLAGILTRRIGFDAAGRRIGVEPLDTFREFAREHGCPEGCAHCEATRRALSSTDVGAL